MEGNLKYVLKRMLHKVEMDYGEWLSADCLPYVEDMVKFFTIRVEYSPCEKCTVKNKCDMKDKWSILK